MFLWLFESRWQYFRIVEIKTIFPYLFILKILIPIVLQVSIPSNRGGVSGYNTNYFNDTSGIKSQSPLIGAVFLNLGLFIIGLVRVCQAILADVPHFSQCTNCQRAIKSIAYLGYISC